MLIQHCFYGTNNSSLSRTLDSVLDRKIEAVFAKPSSIYPRQLLGGSFGRKVFDTLFR